MCSFQHKWASERHLYLFVLLHHVIMKWNSVPVRTSLAHQIRYNKTLLLYFLPEMSGFTTYHNFLFME